VNETQRVIKKALLAGLVLAITVIGALVGIGYQGGIRARNLRGPAHFRGQHQRSLVQRIFGNANPSPQPTIAPFFGNLSALSVPSADGLALQRQTNCSLTFANYTYTFSSILFTSMLNSQTPGYEKTIHNNAFLKTTPDIFAKGCVDSTQGLTSHNIIYMGKGTNGEEMIAVAGSDNVLTFGLKSDGTLTQAASQTTDFPPFSLMSADLNKDGNPDLISIDTSALQSSITVFLSNPDGTFKAGTSFPLPGAVAEFGVVQDLNGDGNLDLLVGSGEPGYQFSIFLGKGDGTFQPAQTFTPPANSASFSDLFIAADVNGDGAMDIITSEGAVFLGKGDGITFTLAPQPAFPPVRTASNQYAPGIVAADFNGDGHLDLATDDGVTIRTYLGKGDGTFTAGPAYATIPNRGFLMATDLDGDGNLDLVTGFAANGFYGGDDFSPNLALTLMGNGNGTFQGAPALPVAYTGTNLADLNGDGRPDLIGLVAGTQSFTAFLTGTNGIPVVGPSLPLPAGVGVDSFAVGDLTGDQIADLIFVSPAPQAQSFYVAIGKGDGSFQTPTATSVPSLVPSGLDINEAITGVRLADFDHDGKLDLIYSFSDQDGTSQMFFEGFAVQLGNGNGTFGPPLITTTYASLNAPQVFPSNMLSAVQDVNRDNFPDVFMVVPNGIVNGTVQTLTQLFVGKGDGTFNPANTLTVTGNVRAADPAGGGSPFAFGDFNGDGKLDLITAGSSSDGTTPQIAISLGNGNGTFQAPTIVTFQGFGFVNSVAVADFDGDGKLDLFASGIIFGGGSGIFPGNGDGTFQTISNGDGTVSASQNVVFSLSGDSVATDLDGDGKPDIIGGNVVLLNRNGSVVPPAAATTTSVTSSLNPSTTGASVTFTATVTSATAGTITGAVTFFDGATQIGTPVTIAAGAAAVSSATLAQGTHSITAQYSGDANFAASTSPAVSQVVNAAGGTAATTTTLVSSLNPSTVGQTVTFTATATSATAGTLTGTISFFDGATQLGNPVTIAAGAATVSSSTLAQGTHSITAKYSGDAKFSTSTSSALSQVVNAGAPISTTTTLTGPATAASGANVTFMASVTPASGTKVPTGTVTFLDGATNLGPGTLNGSGSTTFSTSTLAVGTHSITAQYGGDANFATSTSTALAINITAAAGNFTLSVSPGSVNVTPSQAGMAVVTVTPTNGFDQPVQFSCSNVPEGIDCGFQPASVTPNGAPATTMLAVTEGAEGNSRVRKSAAGIGKWTTGGGGANAAALAVKTLFVPVFGGELLLLAGLWRRRKSANHRGAWQAAFAMLLLVTIATFAGGCSNAPHSRTTGAVITVVATGPNNQTATVPLTINIQK
jgi:hypothetical protein